MTTPLRKVHNSMATRLGFCIVPFVVIVFIVSLGFLFKWSRDMVRQEAIERADCMLTNTTLRAAGFLNEIQTTTNNTVWQINANLNPDSLLALSRRVVQLNAGIYSCSITMEPDFFPECGRYFSAYSYRKGDSVITVREEPYDYYTQVWYKNAYVEDKPLWVDPYNDSEADGTPVPKMISSYCVPLKDRNNQTIGIISTDLSLERLTKAISHEVPYENSYCIIRRLCMEKLHIPSFTTLVPSSVRIASIVGSLYYNDNSGGSACHDASGRAPFIYRSSVAFTLQ